MTDSIVDALKGLFSKKFRRKLKNDTINDMVERMKKKAKKVQRKLDTCNSDQECSLLRKQLKVLDAQINKAKNLKD